MSTGLKGALEGLGTMAADLTSLEVVTYTGRVEQIIKTVSSTVNGTQQTETTIDWGGLLTKTLSSSNTTASTSTSTTAVTQAQLKLVAATKIEFDGDTKHFQTDDLGIPRLPELLEMHRKTVENSLAARGAVVNFLGSAILDLVKAK